MVSGGAEAVGVGALGGRWVTEALGVAGTMGGQVEMGMGSKGRHWECRHYGEGADTRVCRHWGQNKLAAGE